MAKVLFVDDRPIEVLTLWRLANCDDEHELLPVECFESIERTYELVKKYEPDIVFVGHGLGKYPVTGADVVRLLRKRGFENKIVSNSGGGISAFAHSGVKVDVTTCRNPKIIKDILDAHTNEVKDGSEIFLGTRAI